jgi:dihydrofolate reductase
MEKEVMARPQCSVYIAMSLDGFIARVDGSIDWLLPMQQSGDDYGHARFMDSIDAMVCGRKTRETALGFATWPYLGKQCVVLSHREFVPSHGEERYEGPLDRSSIGSAKTACGGSPSTALK